MREQALSDTVSPQQIWENQLDDLGTEASLERLEAHMMQVPDPESDAAKFLAGFVASLRQTSMRTMH